MKIKDGFDSRLKWVYISLLAVAAVILSRLFFVQILKYEYYSGLASNQHISSSGNFDRGGIYFKDKAGKMISAAILKKGYQIAINPKVLENPEGAYDKLITAIQIKKEDFFGKAAKKDDPYEVVARRIGADAAEKIIAMEIKGVSVEPEAWRQYPAENLASTVLGFVGYKGDVLTGRYGVERFYEDVLKRDTENEFSNSFIEIFSGVKKMVGGGEGAGDVILTIEPTVQSSLEEILGQVNDKYKSQSTGGIVIEPKTGKILAMGFRPDFNPNAYGDVRDFSVFTNLFTEKIFEPGSIMKPLTMAAAIDQGAVTAHTKYQDDGFLVLDKKRIENYDGKARGVVEMQEVLNQSLNTGAVFVMQKLGKEKFREYLVNFGFNEQTGIDLPSEAKGMISNVLKSPRDIEYATASFGQGIAVTPIEMATALSSLANGGVLMKPFIVDEIKVESGIGKKIKPQEIRRVIKKETSDEITRMLVKVVDTALVGGQYKMDRYSIAAKTGTAQFKKEGTAGYVPGEYIHTFFGYAPASDPKFMVLLYTLRPQGVQYASHSLTEPFMNIMKFLLNYYEVAPDR